MDYSMIQTFISSVGFPIACVCAMFYMLNKEQEQHKIESQTWAEKLAENTEILRELKDLIKSMKG